MAPRQRTIEGTQHQNYVAVQSLPRVSKRVQPGRTTWRRKGWGYQLSQLKKEGLSTKKQPILINEEPR
jgi:hypothetical protein